MPSHSTSLMSERISEVVSPLRITRWWISFFEIAINREAGTPLSETSAITRAR